MNIISMLEENEAIPMGADGLEDVYRSETKQKRKKDPILPCDVTAEHSSNDHRYSLSLCPNPSSVDIALSCRFRLRVDQRAIKLMREKERRNCQKKVE